MEIENHHLFPEEAGQIKHATTAITHDKQASEYDQKQDHVGNYRRDSTKCTEIALGRHTTWRVLCGEPYIANLRIL